MLLGIDINIQSKLLIMIGYFESISLEISSLLMIISAILGSIIKVKKFSSV